MTVCFEHRVTAPRAFPDTYLPPSPGSPLAAYHLHLGEALGMCGLLPASASLRKDSLLFSTKHKLCLLLICAP